MNSLPEILEQANLYAEELPAAPKKLAQPIGAEIAGWIDHTLLKAEATAEQVRTLCQEALEYKFASVCVNPVFVPLANGLLDDSDVEVCTVVGFPLGATTPTQKIVETLSSINTGATEIDMVINVGALKGEAYGMVLNEVQSLAQVTHNQNSILKVILEMALLTQKEKIIACLICQAAGADYVKTSTGFGPGGATIEDVDLMNRVVGETMKIKAAGGIRDFAAASAMIDAGAARIGASAGVRIVQESIA
jgi:deoxyribose-phosphate aldolase